MKFSFKNLVAFLAMALLTVSCRNSDSDEPLIPNSPNTEVEGLKKFKEITNDTHVIELFSRSGTINLGYNDLKLRIKNKATNQYESNANVSWTPLMHMTMMSHSCPRSSIEKVGTDGTLYAGYIVFQMPGNSDEYWDLKIDYAIGGTNYTATSLIDVPIENKKTVNSFLGTDNVKYVVAYIEPKAPKVAINDMVLGLWKMDDMMNFSLVDDYTVKVDPRMPGMGNHSSPNNTDAKQAAAGELYTGKLALTMTGYWKINLQIAKPDGIVVGGKTVTETNPASNLFFEIDF